MKWKKQRESKSDSLPHDIIKFPLAHVLKTHFLLENLWLSELYLQIQTQLEFIEMLQNSPNLLSFQ